MNATTIYDSIGGFARVRLLVSDLYDKVLESDLLAPYFAGVDMRRIIDHQTRFVSALLGGPASFSDEHIARAHARLQITPAAYEELADLFRETLEDFSVSPGDVERVHAHLLSLRAHIVAEHSGLADLRAERA